jgi:hypothetical protein
VTLLESFIVEKRFNFERNYKENMKGMGKKARKNQLQKAVFRDQIDTLNEFLELIQI